MVNNSSARYYQKTKKATKKARKRYQNLSEKEKGKEYQYDRKRHKPSRARKKKGWLSIEKNI